MSGLKKEDVRRKARRLCTQETKCHFLSRRACLSKPQGWHSMVYRFRYNLGPFWQFWTILKGPEKKNKQKWPQEILGPPLEGPTIIIWGQKRFCMYHTSLQSSFCRFIKLQIYKIIKKISWWNYGKDYVIIHELEIWIIAQNIFCRIMI